MALLAGRFRHKHTRLFVKDFPSGLQFVFSTSTEICNFCLSCLLLRKFWLIPKNMKFNLYSYEYVLLYTCLGSYSGRRVVDIVALGIRRFGS